VQRDQPIAARSTDSTALLTDSSDPSMARNIALKVCGLGLYPGTGNLGLGSIKMVLRTSLQTMLLQ